MLKLNRKIRVLALAMATALAVALLPMHSASANDFMWGGDATFDADMFDSSDWRSLFSYWLQYKANNGLEYPYSVAVCHDLRYWQNRTEMWGFAVSSDDIVGFDSVGFGGVYTAFPDSDIVYFGIDAYSHTPYMLHYASGVKVSDDLYCYTISYGGSLQIPAFVYGDCWCSNNLNNGYSANLYLPESDTRTFEVFQETYAGVDYLRVVVDFDIYGGHNCFLTLTYSDAQGSGYEYTYLRSQFVRNEYDNPYSEFHVPVSSLPTYGNFTITGATFTTASLWGTKSKLLNYSYAGDDIPLGDNYNTIISYNTFETLYGSSVISGNVIGTLYVGTESVNNRVIWKDSEDVFNCNYRLRIVAFPDFMWNAGIGSTSITELQISLEEYYKMFEQCDVVLYGLNEDCFDDIYYDGFYDSLDDIWNQGSALIDYFEKVFEEPPTARNLYPDESEYNIDYYDTAIGIITTRNYLLKRIHYSLGDTDSRLLEFENKLLNSNNGVLTNIQNQFILSYEQDNDFYNKAYDSLRNVETIMTGLQFEDFFNGIIDKLTAIENALNFTFDWESIPIPFKPIWQFFVKSFTLLSDYKADFESFSDALLDDDVPLLPTVTPDTPIIPLPTLYPRGVLIE